MTAREIDVILKRLDQQDADNTRWRDEQREDLHELKKDVKEVKVETKYTNGRVTALERERAEESAVARDRRGFAEQHREHYRWLLPTILTAIFTAIIVAQALHLHL